MFTTFTRGGALVLVGALSLTACDSGEPDGGTEQELITEVVVTLVNTEDATDRATITASDDDGDGADITFSPASIALRPGATYEGTIELNDTINNESITGEIEDLAEEHLFRYAFAPASAGAITITDSESDYTTMNGNGGDFAVGLTFEAEVDESASGPGTLGVILYHFDDAPKPSSTATSDEIDVDIDFPVTFAAPATAL